MSYEDKIRVRFHLCRESMAKAGIGTSHPEAIICPLCWNEAHFDRLTLEDFIPKSIGGRRKILTCDSCNHGGGRTLDWHLSAYQQLQDVIKGQEWLPGELEVNGVRLAAELKIDPNGKEFRVIEEASNPANVAKSKTDFAAGRVGEFSFSFKYGYIVNNFNTAVLKAAYLTAFNQFGYRYLLDENVQAIRRRILDLSLERPQVRTLVIGATGLEQIEDRQHSIVDREVNGVKCVLVLIRAKRNTTSFVGAFLPRPGQHEPEFFERMESHAAEHAGFNIPLNSAAFIG